MPGTPTATTQKSFDVKVHVTSDSVIGAGDASITIGAAPVTTTPPPTGGPTTAGSGSHTTTGGSALAETGASVLGVTSGAVLAVLMAALGGLALVVSPRRRARSGA